MKYYKYSILEGLKDDGMPSELLYDVEVLIDRVRANPSYRADSDEEIQRLILTESLKMARETPGRAVFMLRYAEYLNKYSPMAARELAGVMYESEWDSPLEFDIIQAYMMMLIDAASDEFDVELPDADLIPVS